MGKLLLLRVKEVERTLRLSSATISGDHLNKDDGNEFSNGSDLFKEKYKDIFGG